MDKEGNVAAPPTVFETDSYLVTLERNKEDELEYFVVNRKYGVVEETSKCLPMAMSLAINWDLALKKLIEHKDTQMDMLKLLETHEGIFNN